MAGLIATRLARIPVQGDTLLLGGWQLDVLDVEHHRADRVHITHPGALAQQTAKEMAR